MWETRERAAPPVARPMGRLIGITLAGAVAGAMASTPVAAQAVSLQFSHVNPPTNKAHTMALRFAEVAKKLSDGRLNVTVVPGGQLGGMKPSLDSALLGTPIIAYVPAAIAQDYSNRVSLFSSAFMFESIEQVERFSDGPGGAVIWGEIEKAGLKRLFDSYFGSRQLFSRKCGMKPADFAGLKMRVPPARIFAFNARAIGFSPTPIDFPETYGAAQAGVIDAVDVSLGSYIASKFAETGLKCIMMTNHDRQFLTAFMNKKLFDGLDAGLQKALLDAGKEAAALHKKLILEEEAELVDTLKKQPGLTVIGPEQGLDLAAFRKKARETVVPEFASAWGKELVEAVDKAK